MSKVAVVYWSGTGNTEAMASAVVDGVRESGAEAELFTASEFDASMLSSFDAVAFGCPSMGSEQLEDSEFEPMFNSCEGDLGGKKIALFGSYGWGDGEWMRSWEETCTADGAVLVTESVICSKKLREKLKNPPPYKPKKKKSGGIMSQLMGAGGQMPQQ